MLLDRMGKGRSRMEGVDMNRYWINVWSGGVTVHRDEIDSLSSYEWVDFTVGGLSPFPLSWKDHFLMWQKFDDGWDHQ